MLRLEVEDREPRKLAPESVESNRGTDEPPVAALMPGVPTGSSQEEGTVYQACCPCSKQSSQNNHAEEKVRKKESQGRRALSILYQDRGLKRVEYALRQSLKLTRRPPKARTYKLSDPTGASFRRPRRPRSKP